MIFRLLQEYSNMPVYFNCPERRTPDVTDFFARLFLVFPQISLYWHERWYKRWYEMRLCVTNALFVLVAVVSA